jgi:hypothetical protein
LLVKVKSIRIFLEANVLRDRVMRGFLINKNLCLYYWLRKRIGNKKALRVANTIEKVILMFGREHLGNGTW